MFEPCWCNPRSAFSRPYSSLPAAMRSRRLRSGRELYFARKRQLRHQYPPTQNLGLLLVSIPLPGLISSPIQAHEFCVLKGGCVAGDPCSHCCTSLLAGSAPMAFRQESVLKNRCSGY